MTRTRSSATAAIMTLVLRPVTQGMVLHTWPGAAQTTCVMVSYV